jgi:hypothetical protein
MRRFPSVVACVLLLFPCACAHKDTTTAEPSLPPMLIDARGVVMPLDQAMTKISYRPWIPPRQALKFAVIPPLGDLDTPDHRGIAVEYRYGTSQMLLSQWPQQNFELTFAHNSDITATPCEIVHYKSDGVAWTTRTRLAMTLQPDGNVNSKDVDTEARRLIAAGGCR